ncbi:LytR/AlgR family response regulator transcription factor [Bizionia sediminis]|uniref:LytR/AlgR family response regulator transcription factor n=1 Tax=Bizionia sediminis TaxID=1737064 RepID=A0ABW5KUL9_9FLAO
MHKYTTLIVDDNIANVRLLEFMLTTYCSETVGTILKAFNLKDATDICQTHQPSIMLLDIELGNNETSFALLDSLPDHPVEIIFITAHSQYAIKALNGQPKPVSYILKPVKLAQFIVAIDKAITSLNKRILEFNTTTVSSNLIAIPKANRIAIVKADEVLYLEAEGKHTVFYLSNGATKVANRNIGFYEKTLNTKQFFRIHHGYIVNLNKVVNMNKHAGNYFELTNGSSLPIAKRRQAELRRLLNME